MKLTQAETIAKDWIHELENYCEHIEIAGSIRRRKAEVKDIEIVAMPKITETTNLFGESVQFRNQLDYPLNKSTLNGARFIKSGPRYKQIALPEGINLDLFIVLSPAQWGVIFTIRTGPASFSRWLVTKKRYGGAMPSHLSVKDGALWIVDKIIETPEEKDFFEAIGLGWISPEVR